MKKAQLAAHDGPTRSVIAMVSLAAEREDGPTGGLFPGQLPTVPSVDPSFLVARIQ